MAGSTELATQLRITLEKFEAALGALVDAIVEGRPSATVPLPRGRPGLPCEKTVNFPPQSVTICVWVGTAPHRRANASGRPLERPLPGAGAKRNGASK